MKIFDTHAHLGLIVEDPIERLIVAQEAKRAGVAAILNICNNPVDFDALYKNLISAPNVYFAVGLSPTEAQGGERDWEARALEYAKLPRVVAIGETGLDYFRFGDKTRQIELFIKHLRLADRLNLPLVIHNRDAGSDIFDILKDRAPARGFVLHCFSETRAYAEKIVATFDNAYISFAGNVTYRNARTLQTSVSALPADRLLVESESPFMIPNEYKGKRNKPSYIGSTVNYMATLREEEPETLAASLFENAKKLFGIDSI